MKLFVPLGNPVHEVSVEIDGEMKSRKCLEESSRDLPWQMDQPNNSGFLSLWRLNSQSICKFAPERVRKCAQAGKNRICGRFDYCGLRIRSRLKYCCSRIEHTV